MYLLIDALRMIRDIRRKGGAIDLWGALLNVPQLIGGLVFISTREGQLVLVTVIVTLIVAGQIHKQAPFSRLISICHLPWCALLPWLVYRLATFEHSLGLKAWLYYVFTTILISLILDVADLYRYARGDGRYTWAG
jgi:hypothetical protein